MKTALFCSLTRPRVFRHLVLAAACFGTLCGVSLPTQAAGTGGYAMRPEAQVRALADSMKCWQQAADYQKVDVWLLYSIAYVESSYNPSAVNRNSNGSVDMGMMQINSIWLPELAKYGVAQRDLFDPCTSIYIGAWIVRQNLNRYGYTWLGIGSYNSRDPAKALAYAQRVYSVHQRITGLRPQSRANLLASR